MRKYEIILNFQKQIYVLGKLTAVHNGCTEFTLPKNV